MLQKVKLSKRKAAIQELVKTHAIEDQAALLDLLKKQYDIETNQAVISRDLRSLGIFKRMRGDRMVYEAPSVDVETELLRYAVVSIVHNESTIVVNTVSGTASFVGDYLDKQPDLGILGTLAGENMVFVAPCSVKNIEEVARQLTQRIKPKD